MTQPQPAKSSMTARRRLVPWHMHLASMLALNLFIGNVVMWVAGGERLFIGIAAAALVVYLWLLEARLERMLDG